MSVGAARKAVDPLWNWPNAISGARLLSGPAIAYLIITGAWGPAFVSLGVSGEVETSSRMWTFAVPFQPKQHVGGLSSHHEVMEMLRPLYVLGRAVPEAVSCQGSVTGWTALWPGASIRGP